jgi:DNA-binding transcriptional MocR family regulator
MLGALSLPLLLVGLYQLHSYQQSLTDRSAAIARVEAEGQAIALESWVESHPLLAADPQSLSGADAGELYERLTRRALRGTHAAVAVFDAHDELRRNLAKYAANRALLLEELPKAGFDRFAPADGAFYLYVDVRQFTTDSVAFTKEMLADIGVAATPGVDFDPLCGRHFIRFCYAGSAAEMQQAVERIERWLTQ